MSNKTYQIVTDRIIAALEKGTVPWRQQWSNGAGLGETQNLVTQHQYRGINAMITACQGYADPYWITLKQGNEIGARVRKGEKGTPIVYWLKRSKEKDGKADAYMVPLYSTVFNIAQFEGLDTVKAISKKRKAERIQFNPIEACEAIVKGYADAPTIGHREQRAYYRPMTDEVNMPKPESFESCEAYYAVLFHELTHSTGHGKRLSRESLTKSNSFGSHEYSKEELVAEMGAAFLCAKAGIETSQIDQSAAYIQSWLKVLKGDPKLVMQAASLAQKAADHILGVKAESETEAK